MLNSGIKINLIEDHDQLNDKNVGHSESKVLHDIKRLISSVFFFIRKMFSLNDVFVASCDARSGQTELIQASKCTMNVQHYLIYFYPLQHRISFQTHISVAFLVISFIRKRGRGGNAAVSARTVRFS